MGSSSLLSLLLFLLADFFFLIIKIVTIITAATTVQPITAPAITDAERPLCLFEGGWRMEDEGV